MDAMKAMQDVAIRDSGLKIKAMDAMNAIKAIQDGSGLGCWIQEIDHASCIAFIAFILPPVSPFCAATTED